MIDVKKSGMDPAPATAGTMVAMHPMVSQAVSSKFSSRMSRARSPVTRSRQPMKADARWRKLNRLSFMCCECSGWLRGRVRCRHAVGLVLVRGGVYWSIGYVSGRHSRSQGAL